MNATFSLTLISHHCPQILNIHTRERTSPFSQAPAAHYGRYVKARQRKMVVTTTLSPDRTTHAKSHRSMLCTTECCDAKMKTATAAIVNANIIISTDLMPSRSRFQPSRSSFSHRSSPPYSLRSSSQDFLSSWQHPVSHFRYHS